MKQLSLIRHASAAWTQGQPDIARLLTEKGVTECHKLAKKLLQADWRPTIIHVSPAQRTQQTCQIIQQHLGAAATICLQPALYEADSQTLFKLIQETDNATQHLCLVGHNPGLSDIATRLDYQQPSSLSPGCAVHFQCDVEHWINVTDNSATRTFFFTPT